MKNCCFASEIMDGNSAGLQKLEELEKEKRKLVARIKEIGAALREKRKELSILSGSVRGKGGLSGGRMKAEVEKIEFQISTSAYTPAQEKQLIKRLAGAQKVLADAMKVDGVREKLDAAKAQADVLSAEYYAVDGSLKRVRGELERLYTAIIEKNKESYQQARKARQDERNRREEEARRATVAHRRKEERSENEPYMKEVDPFVSLEEIAEIKRKPKQVE